ncbi:hypothetical protein CMQ_4659 [Grosmannia clavigera kw1407]|uniref:Involucrin repeat protein n=1 Tax=Grosmannia clavigera (strain kw1407 / UAMH 11150) TaxID=655863 RepID=F0XTT7_GROCL|nr:uncharacterized protein CMQ_4659 [Grosmannia clavigera kw1407]EFW98807.1 hypothetical protein CMQ_4659 [Grosmannia clavigera kw1407]
MLNLADSDAPSTAPAGIRCRTTPATGVSSSHVLQTTSSSAAVAGHKDERIAQLERELADRTDFRAEWETIAARDEELRTLRLQVRGLKERVSTATRAEGVTTSDEVLAGGMARLANGLQNWVIVHFRRAKLAHPDDCYELTQLVPMHELLRHSAKLHLLQSAVARLLVDHVFAAYYVGLSSELAAQLSQIEAALLSYAGSAGPINQWRALTLAIVSRDAAKQLPPETDRLIDDVVGRISSVLDRATTTTTTTSTDDRNQALRLLVAGAVDLSRLLVAQRAVFRIFMPNPTPHQQLLFDPSTMEDLGCEEDDDDGLARREVAFLAFPGIIKHGDETGGQLQYRNVICKARVTCARKDEESQQGKE